MDRSFTNAMLVVTIALPSVAAAQASFPDTLRAPCTYATCAIRLEPGFFGARLVRGAASENVGERLGGFGGGVEPLLAGKDSAAAYGREYVDATRRSTTLGLLGAVAFGAGLIMASANHDSQQPRSEAGAITASLIGSGLLIAALPYVMRAQRKLSRSIWWYNAGLPR